MAVRIAPEDIDELNHVNNIIYLRWAQEIAIAHWRSRATPAMLMSYIWVVTRHEVDYRAPLELGDAVEASTWVDIAPRGPLWARFVEISKPGGKIAAEIKSTWCLLDSQTRRVKRVPAEMAKMFSSPG